MRFLWILLFIALPGLGQELKIDTQVQTDTVMACRKKYLFSTVTKTIHQPNNMVTDACFYVVSLGRSAKDTLMICPSLPDEELQVKLHAGQELSLPAVYEKGISYEFISENVLTICHKESQYFPGAAHGENRYENAFFDMETRKPFGFADVFQDSVQALIAWQVNREFAGTDQFEPVALETFKVNRYDFDPKNLILEFHYLDADSPVPVSYAEQVKKVYIPYKMVSDYLKKDSPIYKMVNGSDCWNAGTRP